MTEEESTEEVEQESIDLSSLDFQSWLTIIFESPRAWAPDALSLNASNSEIILEYFSRMCVEFACIGEKYNWTQIDNGIWRTFTSSNIEPSIAECLVVPNPGVLQVSKQISAIKSIYFVYADFVSQSTVEVMANCFYMWWCELNHTFWFNAEYSRTGKAPRDYDHLSTLLTHDEKDILEAIFETLVRIFELSDERSKECALHGLGTSHHSGVKNLVQKYIDEHCQQLEQTRLKLLAAYRDCTVQ